MNMRTAAGLIADARRSGHALERLPEDCRPTSRQEGFEVQKHVAELLGAEIEAWKVLPSGAKESAAAPIFRGTVHQAPYVAARLNTLETEIALRLARDLPARPGQPYTRAEILGSVDAFALTFEMVDWRLTAPDLTVPERLSDCFANEGLILGPVVPFQEDFSSPVNDLTLLRDGMKEPFNPVDIDPVESLRAYVSLGGDLFGGLKAGQWVITGSMTGLQKVAGPSKWRAMWRDVAEVAVEVLS